MFWTEVLRGKEKEEGELWNVLDWSAGMVGNKRGKKEKRKEKSVGTWVEEEKRGKKKKRKKKKRKESPRVWREKKIYHNIFTIFLQ